MARGQKGGGLFNSLGYGNGYETYTTESGVTTGVLQYIWYALVLTVALVAILVLVHYMITPIFITKPGEKGYIPLPGTDDALIYWKNSTDIKSIPEAETPLGQIFENWSMALDIQVDNPTANTTYPRILFSRGQKLNTPTGPYTASSTILTINPDFNCCIWLDRLTNDLNVSVQTRSENGQQAFVETIQVPNVPVGKSIRVGVMVGSRVLEVYVNGYLAKSKTFLKGLRSVPGELQPPFDTILSTTARVLNLRVWPRPLSPSEFRALGPPANMDIKDMPDSCAA